jgi:hypothetical protein
VQVGGSQRFCSYYGGFRYSQMLSGLCCSLHFILALLPQREEIKREREREREREKRKKAKKPKSIRSIRAI